jgi:uncharacterized protein
MATEAAGVRTTLGEWVHRPLLGVDPDQAGFWEGLRAHEFPLCRCRRCGSWWWPYTVCTKHADIPEFEDMEWAPSSGRGTIFAKLVVYQADDPAFVDEVPYTLSIVSLDEGPNFPARLVDCDPDDVQIGDRVEVVYLDSEQAGHTLAFFRPVAAGT